MNFEFEIDRPLATEKFNVSFNVKRRLTHIESISREIRAKFARKKKKKKEKIEGIKIAKNKKNADISHWN